VNTKNFKKITKKKNFKIKFLKKLISFIRPFKYHHNSYNKLTKGNLRIVQKFLINKWYGMRINDSKELRMSVSPLFNKLIRYFERKAKNNHKNPKLLIFSGHDTNLVNFLTNILDTNFIKKKMKKAVDDAEELLFLVPPLASSILLELHRVKKTKQYFIRIIYNGENISNKIQLKGIKSIKTLNGILLNDFLKLMKSRLDNDYKRLICGKKLNLKMK